MAKIIIIYNNQYRKNKKNWINNIRNINLLKKNIYSLTINIK